MAPRASKSQNAFRTISEVANSMGIQQHVLRFWESKFSQISPMKRGGGRRYYRPEDVEIIEVIRNLLHEDGYTIKGAQKYLKEHGVKNVLQAFNDKTDSASDSPESNYEAQLMNVTKKRDQHITGGSDTVASLKNIRARLEKARKTLKVDS